MNHRRSSAVAILAVALLAGCEALTLTDSRSPPPKVAGPPVATNFVIGPANFSGADSIRIDEVEASSPAFKVGDRVIVRGWYDLSSRDSAELRLFIRSFDKPRYLTIKPEQFLMVHRGVGPFQFEWSVPLPGALYVAFYPEETGGPFGGVYFGSHAQMDRAARIEGL